MGVEAVQPPPVQGYPAPYPPAPAYASQQAYQHSPTEPLSNTDSGSWSTGLCECMSDCETCCCVVFCPCIQVGRNAEIISEGRTECPAAAVIWYLIQGFTGCGCLYTAGHRKMLRTKYQLPEAPCNDYCTHCFCAACAICQEGRELKNRGWDLKIGYAANMTMFAATHGVPMQQAMYK